MKIGIIGAGWWAAQAYIPLLQANDRVTEIAVCRPDREGLDKVRATFGLEHAFTDATTMLETRDPDGVIVSSPHVLHAEHAMMCLERGLPVMVEKPMTTTTADARRLAAAATAGGTPLVVAYGWNFGPLAIRARKLVDDGWIGEVEHATCLTATGLTDLFAGKPLPSTVDHVFRPPVSTWADPKRAGGYGWGQLTHALGVLFLLVEEEPAGAYARMQLSEVGVDLSDAGVVALANGASVAVSGTARIPRRRKQVDIRIHGSKGALFLDLERERLEVHGHDGTSHVESVAQGDGDYEVGRLVDSFVGLAGGDDIANHADAGVGLRATAALDAMYRSAKSGVFENV